MADAAVTEAEESHEPNLHDALNLNYSVLFFMFPNTQHLFFLVLLFSFFFFISVPCCRFHYIEHSITFHFNSPEQCAHELGGYYLFPYGYGYVYMYHYFYFTRSGTRLPNLI